MYKRRKYLLTAPPLCSALPLKTEVYARGAGCNFDFAATNGTVVACDGLAKITITHNNNGSTLPAGAIIEYRLDMETWQTSNVITGVSYADHVVSIRMTNGSQVCYATKNLAAVLFSDCGVLSCDFRIVAKDGTNNETSTLARDPATKGLKTLKLSLESLDGSDLSKGVTYYWERFAKNPNDAGGSKVFVSSQAAVSIGAVGRYTVALVRGSITCTTEIAINSKPCLDTPEPTTKCETKALTGVSDEIANRLTDLAVGDVVRCGDFNVTITEATGGPFEGWTGKGYVTVPYVNATVSIILKKAVFNDCYQLTNANATAELPTVFTEYDDKYFAKSGDLSATDEAETIGEAKKIIDLSTSIADEMQDFKCDDPQRARLNKALADLEAVRQQAQTNDIYTVAQKAQINTSVTNITTLVNSLLSCCVPPTKPGMRTAAEIACSINGPKSILDATIAENKEMSKLVVKYFFEASLHGVITEEAWDEACRLYPTAKYSVAEKRKIGDALRYSVMEPDGALVSIKEYDYHFDARKNFNEIQLNWVIVDLYMRDEPLLEPYKGKIAKDDCCGNPLPVIIKAEEEGVSKDRRVEKFEYQSPLGFRMHTVQDFYAHSNYVERYVEYYAKKNNNNLINFNANMIPTWTEASDKIGHPEHLEFFNELQKKKIDGKTIDHYLFTGNFDFFPDGIYAGLKKIGKPYFYDKTTQDKHHHNAISKDLPDEEESYHGSEEVFGTINPSKPGKAYKWYYLAKDVAKRHCIAVFKKRLE